MAKEKVPPFNIYQNRNGINFIDGFYFAKNPVTGKVNMLSISKGRVYIHDVIRQMTLQELINWDYSGRIEVFDELKSTKKPKT